MRILAGDIGATKTVLGLFERGPVRPKLLHSMTYSSQGYDSLESIISEFMLTADGSIDTACFGVPGPVLRGECRTTNLKWVVSVENLKSHLNTLKVVLVNDLVATAIAAPKLFEHEYVILNTGECDPTGALGIVAPGTGLGMALMIWTSAILGIPYMVLAWSLFSEWKGIVRLVRRSLENRKGRDTEKTANR